MKKFYNHYKIPIELKQLPTKMYGMKYKPSIEPDWSDKKDYFSTWGSKISGKEITSVDKKYMINFMNENKNNFNIIVEIGVCRNCLEDSFTKYFIEIKNNKTYFIGIDLNNKSFLNNKDKLIYTIQGNSKYVEKNMDTIESITGERKIDLIFIDGYHGINSAYNDCGYLKYLSKNGVAMFHDISIHPSGLVFDALNEKLFKKEKIFLHHEYSSGIGIATKGENNE